MSNWPNTIPCDLKCKMQNLAGLRFTGTDKDRWGVFKEWLEAHGIEAPEHSLPQEPEL